MAADDGRRGVQDGTCAVRLEPAGRTVRVAQGALLGKIIPAGRRGSALSAAHTISGPVNLLAILGV